MQRFFHLDALRAIIMFLGIISHTAYIYTGVTHWIVQSNEKTIVADVITLFLHSFRMHAFFIIAGFFSLMLIEKKQRLPYLILRGKRLIFPLLAGLISINSIQLYMGYLVDNRGTMSAWSYFTQGGIWKDIQSQDIFFHLWFLVNLSIYTLLFAFIPMPKKWGSNLTTAQANAISWAIILVCPAWEMFLHALGRAWPPMYSSWEGVTSLYGQLRYISFFFMGMVLFRNRSLFEAFHNFDLKQVACLGLCWYVKLTVLAAPDSPFLSVANLYIEGVITWQTSRLAFALAKRALDFPSAILRYLSEASYTVYLFHHIMVFYLGWKFTKVQWPVLLEMLIIVSASCICTLAIHHFIILRFPWVQLIFNGKDVRQDTRPANPIQSTAS